MAKTTAEKLKRARSWLTGRKWKLDKHRMIASVGYEALTVKLSLSEEHDGLPREFLEAAVKAIYTDEAGVENAALQVIEGADYGGTWILREAGIERTEPGGEPATDNRLALWKKYVRRTAVNPMAWVMEDNCTYLVSYTWYLGVLGLPAVPAGSSGITYRLTSSNYDREEGLWDCILERKEQKTTTTGVIVVEDDAFKTVEQQGFYGIRTGNLDEDGAAVALWAVNDDVQGTTVRDIFTQKNENCTTDIIQQRTVQKDVAESGRRTAKDQFETLDETESVNGTALGDAPAAAGGLVTEHRDDLTEGGKYKRTLKKTQEEDVDAAEVTAVKDQFAERTETESVGTDPLGAPPEAAAGVVTTHKDTKTPGRKYKRRVIENKELDVDAAEVLRSADQFETVTETESVGAAALGAPPEAAAGKVTTHRDVKTPGRKFKRRVIERQELDVDAAETVATKDQFAERTETESVGAEPLGDAPEAAAGKVTTHRDVKTPGRKYKRRVIENQELDVDAAEVTLTNDQFESVLETESVNGTPLGACPAAAGGLIVTHRDVKTPGRKYRRRKTERQEWDVEAAEATVERDAFGSVLETESVNGTPLGDAPEAAAGVVVKHRDAKTPGRKYKRRVTVRTEADVAQAERVTTRDAFGAETATESVDGAPLGDAPAAAAGVVTTHKDTLTAGRKWRRRKVEKAETERLAAITRTVKTIWGRRDTVIDRSATAAGTFEAGETGTVENKLTPGERFDRERTTETLDETVGLAGVETEERKGGDFFETWIQTQKVVSGKDPADVTGLGEDGKVYEVTYATDEATGIIRKTVRVRTATAAVSTLMLDKQDTHAVPISVLFGKLMEHTKIVQYTNTPKAVWQAELAAFSGSHVAFWVNWGGYNWVYRYDNKYGVGLRINDFGLWDGILTMQATASLENQQTESV